MNQVAVKQIEIVSNLARVPPEKLEEVSDFVKFILLRSKTKQKQPISLRGFWKKKGFESLDIESELKTMRQEVANKLDSMEI